MDDAVQRIVGRALAANTLQVIDTSSASLESLVRSLDTVAWDLQDEAEGGAASQAAYHQAFCRARAANAMPDLVKGSRDAAVYEAAHGL